MRIPKTSVRISDELHYIILGKRELDGINYIEASLEIAQALKEIPQYKRYYDEGKFLRTRPFGNLIKETRIDNIVKL